MARGSVGLLVIEIILILTILPNVQLQAMTYLQLWVGTALEGVTERLPMGGQTVAPRSY